MLFRSVTGALGVGAVVLNPSLLERFTRIYHDLTAYGSERAYLIKVGLRMYHDNPVWGVGLGAFEKRFLTRYLDYKTVGDGVTLSHTSVITVMAELGTLGLIGLGLFLLSLVHALYRLSKAVRYIYVLGIGYMSWILTVFISSQMEARFFEDPVLWVSVGMLVSLVLNNQEKYFITPQLSDYKKPVR